MWSWVVLGGKKTRGDEMRLDVTEGSGSEAPTRGTLRPPVVVVVLCVPVPYRTVHCTETVFSEVWEMDQWTFYWRVTSRLLKDH